jgi:preprotein translocase subunit Sec61beta
MNAAGLIRYWKRRAEREAEEALRAAEISPEASG